MDLEETKRLRCAIEALQTTNKVKFRGAVPEALWYARENPREVVRSTVVFDDSIPRVCRTFRALGSAGSLFRNLAVNAIPSLLPELAKQGENTGDSRCRARARRDLALLARVIDEWDAVYATDGCAISRVASYLTAQYSKFREAFEVARANRERQKCTAIDKASGLSALEREQVPDVAALLVRKRCLVSRAERLLDEVKTIFSLLGEAGVRELARGGSDGMRDALRDVWARLLRAEEEIAALFAHATLRMRLLSLNLGDETDHSSIKDARDTITELRSTLDRVENERVYCRALCLHVPDRRGASAQEDVQISDGNKNHRDSSDDAEEWDDAVVVKESDGEDEDCAQHDVQTQLPPSNFVSQSAVPPLNRPGKPLTSSSQAVAAVTGRATAMEHNAQILASMAPSSASTKPKRTGNEPSRERLKKMLGKKRSRSSITLSPDTKKRGR